MILVQHLLMAIGHDTRFLKDIGSLALDVFPPKLPLSPFRSLMKIVQMLW